MWVKSHYSLKLQRRIIQIQTYFEQLLCANESIIWCCEITEMKKYLVFIANNSKILQDKKIKTVMRKYNILSIHNKTISIFQIINSISVLITNCHKYFKINVCPDCNSIRIALVARFIRSLEETSKVDANQTLHTWGDEDGFS